VHKLSIWRVTRRHLLLCGLAAGPWLSAPPAWAGLPEVVATARLAVVAVGVFDPLASPRFSFRGSGFVVGDGQLVATNAHVLPDDPADLKRMALQPAGNRRTGDSADRDSGGDRPDRGPRGDRPPRRERSERPERSDAPAADAAPATDVPAAPAAPAADNGNTGNPA
jgi:hypothetical protein